MASEENNLDTYEKLFLRKLKDARSDRMLAAPWINDAMSVAMPNDKRINDSNTPRNPSDNGDIFDTELQIVLDDFGSDMNNLFTPRHEKWVNFTPKKELSDGEKKQLQDGILQASDKIFSTIEESNFYEAAGPCYKNWAISVGGIAINNSNMTGKIDCQSMELPIILIARGPNGTFDGRFRDWGSITKLDLHYMWPQFFDRPRQDEENKKEQVVEGYVRNWDERTVESWHYGIIVKDKLKHHKILKGAGCCGFIIFPWQFSSTTAWKPGPVQKALPYARTLDRLTYDKLNASSRAIDPPMSYEEDGIINVEGGIEAGTWVPRAVGSEAPQPIESKARFDVAAFNTADLEKKIKRILYQDRPEQKGLTPPTATQLLEEKAFNTRRLELPRDLATNHWVIPIIERFTHLLVEKGQDIGVYVDKQFVELKAVTPLSKARDLEDINTTNMVLNIANQIATIAANIPQIDAQETILAISAKAQERHIKFKSANQLQQEQLQQTMMQNAPQLAQAMGGMNEQPK